MFGDDAPLRATLFTLALLTPPLVGTQAPAAAPPSSDDVVARASGYVAAYRKAFAFLVADETYSQRAEVARSAGGRGAIAGAIQQRTLRGEMFLTYLEADRRWVALRDVAEVDGVPVFDRTDLRALLAASSVQSVAARLFHHNARYNLGDIARNFNEPTLALQVLDAASLDRFRFRVDARSGDQSASGLVRLEFRERDRPTLVRSVDGRPIYSVGELMVEPGSGSVRRARIAFRHDVVEAELVTTFIWHDRLSLWLPSIFTERYTSKPRAGRAAETITTEARYDNYRRFEGRARIGTSR